MAAQRSKIANMSLPQSHLTFFLWVKLFEFRVGTRVLEISVGEIVVMRALFVLIPE